MKLKHLVLGCIISLGQILPGSAKDLYVSQNGSGTTNSMAWLNSAAAWGVGANKISPGDTVHLTGVITNGLDLFNGGGHPGHPITILFDPNARMSTPAAPVPYSIWIYIAAGNFVIDGGVNGVIQCTANGTGPAYGGTNQFSVGGIIGVYVNTGCSNITIQNLTISNLYNRLPASADPEEGATGNSTAIYENQGGSNLTNRNNAIWNSQDGIDYCYGGNTISSNVFIISNSIVGYNHAITFACSGIGVNPQFINGQIRSNYLNGMDVYESTDVSVGLTYFHRDGIFVFNECHALATSVDDYPIGYKGTPAGYYSGVASNLDISGNYIGPGLNPVTASAGSGGIWVDNYETNQYDHLLIYNNILILKPPLEYNDCWIGSGYSKNSMVANNTIIGWQTNMTGGGIYYSAGAQLSGTSLFYNNLVYNIPGIIEITGEFTSDTGASFQSNICSYIPAFYSDYNVLPVMSGSPAYEIFVATQWGSSNFTTSASTVYTLKDWQNKSPLRYDAHSTTNVAAINTNTWLPLASDTVAAAAGTNLSAYFTTDFYGNIRAATGAWDIGAGALNSTPPPKPALLAPTGLHVVSGSNAVANASGTIGGAIIATVTNGTVYNFYNGSMGGEFTPVVDMTITALGRWVVAGNSLSHVLTLSMTGNATPIASVTVNTAGAASGAWLYGTFPTPVAVYGGTTYNIASTETAGGDQWYYSDSTCTITDTNSITWVGATIQQTGQAPSGASAPGFFVFGPVNAQYTVP